MTMTLADALALADHASPMPHLAGDALRVLRAELERLRAAAPEPAAAASSPAADLRQIADDIQLCALLAMEDPRIEKLGVSQQLGDIHERLLALINAACPDCKAIVERVARAICVRVGTYDPDESVEVGGGRSIPGWCVYQPEASAALKAVFAHG